MGEERERRRQGGRALVRVKQSQSDFEQSVIGTAQSGRGKKGHKIFSCELCTVHNSKAGIEAVGWKAQVNSHLRLSANHFSFPFSVSMLLGTAQQVSSSETFPIQVTLSQARLQLPGQCLQRQSCCCRAA